MKAPEARPRLVHIGPGDLVLTEGFTYQLVPPAGLDATSCHWGPVPLTRASDGSFLLRVGHSVGKTTLTFTSAHGAHCVPVDLRPCEAKLDLPAWTALLDDLKDWLPGLLVGLSEGGLGASAQDGVPAGLVAAAVVPLVGALLDAAKAVLRAPKRREQESESERRMHAIRQAHPSTLRWLGRHPYAAAALGASPGPASVADPWVPLRVRTPTLDHPANRAVRWLLERVARHLRPVAHALRVAAQGEFDAVAAWCVGKAGELGAAADALDALVAQSFLARLTPEPPGAGALLTLADDPAYARVLRAARAILGARFSANDASGRPVPSRSSFELYELWCLLAIRRALDEAAGPAPWTHRTRRTNAPLLAVDLHGLTLQRALPDGVLVLHYNATFTSHLSAPGGERVALTGERRPDFVLGWQPHAGEPTWLVLDAKYRVQRTSLVEAFESLHVYRDGLRWPARGGRPRMGLLLVPTVAPACAPWADETFLDEHGFGLWELRPGQKPDGRLGRRLFGSLGIPLPAPGPAR